MKLYDLLNTTLYYHKFYIFATNNFDQNILVAHGTRKDIVNEDLTDGFDYLMHKVELIENIDNNTTLVLLKNKPFNKRAEDIFDPDAVKTWKERPEKRPYRHMSEIQKMIKDGTLEKYAKEIY